MVVVVSVTSQTQIDARWTTYNIDNKYHYCCFTFHAGARLDTCRSVSQQQHKQSQGVNDTHGSQGDRLVHVRSCFHCPCFCKCFTVVTACKRLHLSTYSRRGVEKNVWTQNGSLAGSMWPNFYFLFYLSTWLFNCLKRDILEILYIIYISIIYCSDLWGSWRQSHQSTDEGSVLQLTLTYKAMI